MPSTRKNDSTDSGWRQLEEFVDQLHQLAHSPLEQQEFYRRLLQGCVAALAADGGAVWLPQASGGWQLLNQVALPDMLGEEHADHRSAHFSFLQHATRSSEAILLASQSSGEASPKNPTNLDILTCAVESDASSPETKVVAVVELFMRPGQSPDVQQGWQEMLSTVCHVAANYHLVDTLRTLQTERNLHDQSLALLRRINQPTNLQRTVFEIANEGRRLVEADRLSVVLKQGRTWQVATVSGVERIEKRGDTAKKLEALAEKVAHWAEPIDSGMLETVEGDSSGYDDLPPELSSAIEQQLDVSHARRFVAVPVQSIDESKAAESKSKSAPLAVIVAEQFDNAANEFSCQRVVELAQLSEAALKQAVQLDRFPTRTLLHWSDRLAQLKQSWGLSRLLLSVIAAVAVICALIFVERDFEIEAPATLTPVVERDVFATSNGKVTQVLVAHGQQVEANQTLAMIEDPQLSLDTQRVQGEIATARKRLEAIAVARTDRTVQADVARDRLPLSAEAQQLEQQIASLEQQQEILATRQQELTVRSPIAGTVLTLDVQNLLHTRPVERGQVLFKVADVQSGWWLWAYVEQDRMGYLVTAQQTSAESLPARIRFAGEGSETYTGHVETISEAAVLHPEQLNGPTPTLRVRVAVDQQDLPTARPRMTAKVRIRCGQRSLGYLWLHDVWETIYSWVVF